MCSTKIPSLEIYQVEESGTGDILSQTFLDWRTKELPALSASEVHHASKEIDRENTSSSTLLITENGSNAPQGVTLDAHKTELLAALRGAVESKPP